MSAKNAKRDKHLAEEERIAKLEEIYARLPKIECKQLCAECCGPIALSPLEAKRLKNEPRRNQFPDCPHLDGKLCTVYKLRPLICRLYGVANGLTCSWGCKPERLVSKEEAAKLLSEVESLSGSFVVL